jgi:hypothetical protein
LRRQGPRPLRPARLLQRRHLPGTRMADRGQEDARPGDGRASRRAIGLADVETPRRDRLPDRRRDRRRRHGQGLRRATSPRPDRLPPSPDGLRAVRGDDPDRPRLRFRRP